MSDTEDESDAPVEDADGSTDATSESDDDGGFDKEAEREKLRKKYEKEEARREATQQMSDLLLKGATMTNAHCNNCGNPIFRYDGEEFCGNCGRTYGTDADDANQDDQPGEQATQPPQNELPADARTTQQADARPTQQADARTTQQADARPTRQTDARSSQESDPTQQPINDRPALSDDTDDSHADDTAAPPDLDPEQSLSPDPSELQASADRETSSRRASPGRGSSPSGGLGGSLKGTDEPPSLSQTQASLRRAIVSLAEQAAQSDDPKRAKNLLEAAREGTEALAVLTPDE